MSFSLFGKKSCLAVDVGTAAVKICRIAGGGGKYKAELADSLPMPPGLTGKDFEIKSAELLTELVSKHKLKKQSAIFALPSQAVIIRYLTFQGIPREKLEGVIRHEAEGHIPFPLAEVSMDWCEARKKENGFDILLVAIKRDKLESMVAIIEDAGLEVQMVDVTTLALFSLYYQTYLKDQAGEEEGAEVFVDIGAGTTDIAFLKNQRVFFTRSVPIAGRSFTEIIAKRMNVPEEKAEEWKIKFAEVKAIAADISAAEGTGARAPGFGMAKAPGAGLPSAKAAGAATGLGAPKPAGLGPPSAAGGLTPPKPAGGLTPPAAGGLTPPKPAGGLTPPAAGGLTPPKPAGGLAPPSAPAAPGGLKPPGAPAAAKPPESPAPPPPAAGSEESSQENKDIPKKVTEVALPKPPLMSPPGMAGPAPSKPAAESPADKSAGLAEPPLPKPPTLSMPKPPTPAMPLAQPDPAVPISAPATPVTAPLMPPAAAAAAATAPVAVAPKAPPPAPGAPKPPSLTLPKPPATAAPAAQPAAPPAPAAPAPAAQKVPAPPPLGAPKPPSLSLPKPPVGVAPSAPPAPLAPPAPASTAPAAAPAAPRVPPPPGLPKPPGMSLPKPPAPPDGKSLGAAKAGDSEVFNLFEGEDEKVEKDKLTAAVKPIADRLATEFRRSFDYFSGQLSGGDIKKVTLSGGGAALKGLAEYLSAQLNVPVTVYNPAEKISGQADFTLAQHQHFSVAYGMGIRVLDKSPIEVNLLPENIVAVRRMRSMGKDIKLLGVAAVFFLTFAAAFALRTYQNTSTLHTKLMADIQELEPIVSRTRQLEKDQKTVDDMEKSISSLVGGKARWIDVLIALDKTLPDNASIVNMTMPVKERMEVRIIASTLNEIPEIGRRFQTPELTKNLFTIVNRPTPVEIEKTSGQGQGQKFFQVDFMLQINHAAALKTAGQPGT